MGPPVARVRATTPRGGAVHSRLGAYMNCKGTGLGRPGAGPFNTQYEPAVGGIELQPR